jgi:hypothetical protein
MTAPSPPDGPGLVADPQADLRARVERAEATLERSTRKSKREVLAAKLRLATKQRSTQAGEEIARVGAEMAARNNYNSGARLESCWRIAITRAREAAEVVTTACLELGIAGQDVADFVALDVEHFLTERALAFGRESPRIGNVVQAFTERARIESAGMRDFVRSREHDFEEQQGTRLERWIKRLQRRPAVTVAVLLWTAAGFVYGHVEALRHLAEWMKRR